MATKNKTKKMTVKYWNSLDRSSRERALKYCFPIHPAIVDMLLNEDATLKSDWWVTVFEKVRIPVDAGSYKTVVNGDTYLM